MVYTRLAWIYQHFEYFMADDRQTCFVGITTSFRGANKNSPSIKEGAA
jgi:hypothetical protein